MDQSEAGEADDEAWKAERQAYWETKFSEWENMDFRMSKTYFHILQLSTVWRAVDLEMRLGFKRYKEYMKTHSFFPAFDTWKVCVGWENHTRPENDNDSRPRYLGLLWYLLVFRVPCSHLPELLRFCIDNDRQLEMLLLTQMRQPVVTEHGKPWVLQKHLYCDRAVKRFYGIVPLVQLIFGKLFFRKPERVLEHLFRNWNITRAASIMLACLVPHHATLRSSRALRMAVYFPEAIHFAVQVCDPCAFNEHVLMDIAAHGHLGSLHVAITRSEIPMSQQIWNEAFFNEQHAVTNAFPEFTCSREAIIRATREGYLNIVSRFKGELPRECMINAVASGNSQLIEHVFLRIPQMLVTRRMLDLAISARGDLQQTVHPVLMLLKLSNNLKLLDDDLKCKMVEAGLTQPLQFLHDLDVKKQLNLNLFSESVFLRACATHNVTLLELASSQSWSRETLECAESEIFRSKFDLSVERTPEWRELLQSKRQKCFDVLCGMQRRIK